MRRIERHDIVNVRVLKALPDVGVFAIKRISHDRFEGPLSGHGFLYQPHCQIELGTKCGISAPARKPSRRRGRDHFQRVIDLFVSPQAADRDHAIINLAHIAQILPADRRGMGASFDIPSFINHQHPVHGGGGIRRLPQYLAPSVIDGAFIIPVSTNYR